MPLDRRESYRQLSIDLTLSLFFFCLIGNHTGIEKYLLTAVRAMTAIDKAYLVLLPLYITTPSSKTIRLLHHS